MCHLYACFFVLTFATGESAASGQSIRVRVVISIVYAHIHAHTYSKSRPPFCILHVVDFAAKKINIKREIHLYVED